MRLLPAWNPCPGSEVTFQASICDLNCAVRAGLRRSEVGRLSRVTSLAPSFMRGRTSVFALLRSGQRSRRPGKDVAQGHLLGSLAPSSVALTGAGGLAKPERLVRPVADVVEDVPLSPFPVGSRQDLSVRPSKLPRPRRTEGNSADEAFMRQALLLAREAYSAGEVPIGAILVDERGAVIGRGRNRVEKSADASAHAEMEALRGAGVPAATARGWRRSGCTLYTTVEPCAMCYAAASLARVRRVVFAARDLRLGACGTWIDLSAVPHPFHMMDEVSEGILEVEAGELMKSFFRERRKQT